MQIDLKKLDTTELENLRIDLACQLETAKISRNKVKTAKLERQLDKIYAHIYKRNQKELNELNVPTAYGKDDIIDVAVLVGKSTIADSE